MMTFLVLVSFVQSGGGFSWTSDEIRTWMLGVLTTAVLALLRVTWTLRDDTRDMKRDLPHLKELLELHEKEIRWLTGKRIAQEAIEEAERQSYTGSDRRHRLRRDRDIVNEALSHSDEHQYPEDRP